MKISIITATHNSGQTVEYTIESILNQSYKDIEYIVIDGDSKDNTLEVFKRYEPHFEGRMKIISEPDSGIYDAMNKGINMATGDIVGILNSDDFYNNPDFLATVAHTFASNDIDAIYGDIHYVDNSDLSRCVRYYSSAGFKPWHMRMGWLPAHPSFYCKREIYERYGTFDCSFKIGGDFDLLLRLIFVHRIKTKYIAMDCLTMRTRGASTSGFKSHKQIFKDHMRAYKKNNVYSNFLLDGSRYIVKVIDLLLQRVKML